MRVAYTERIRWSTGVRVGYTFQMRVAYTIIVVSINLVLVGYTFQMRVAYTKKQVRP